VQLQRFHFNLGTALLRYFVVAGCQPANVARADKYFGRHSTAKVRCLADISTLRAIVVENNACEWFWVLPKICVIQQAVLKHAR
jgi:hypothetical protein